MSELKGPFDARPQLVEFRKFLTDVRVRAANQITEYVCAGRDPEEFDPADVHEDVREAMWPFFLEIQERVCGPECSEVVRTGPNVFAKCDLHAKHRGPCHPCVGEPYDPFPQSQGCTG